jgi:hypothetical protein
VHPLYLADPIFEGGEDPLPVRWGIARAARDAAEIISVIETTEPSQPRGHASQVRYLKAVGTYVNSGPKTKHRYPEDWREVVAKIGSEESGGWGFHEVVLRALIRLAEEHRRAGNQLHLLSAGARSALLATELSLVAERVRLAPRGKRDITYVERMVADIPRMLGWAIGRVFSQGAALAPEPTYPDRSVAREEGEKKIEAALTAFNANALSYLETWKQENLAIWVEERRPSDLLLKPAHFARPRHLLLAVEVGAGKTRRAVRRALRDLKPRANRVYFVVRYHHLAVELVQVIEDELSLMAAEGLDTSAIPRPMVFKGREQPGMCLAPPKRQAAAKGAGDNRLPVQQTACKGCPAQGTDAETGCKHYWQEDLSPGIKIVVTATLGSNSIPGLPRTLEARDRQYNKGLPSIVAVFVDEGFGDTFIKNWEIRESALRNSADVAQLLEAARDNEQTDASDIQEEGEDEPKRNAAAPPHARKERDALHDAILLANRALNGAKELGDVPLSVFHEELRTGKLDKLRSTLRDLIHRATYAAARNANAALAAGLDPDFKGPTLAALRKIEFLYELLTAVRFAPPSREHLQCVSRRGTGKEAKIVLRVHMPIPEVLASYPLAILNATAEDHDLIPFGDRDEVGNFRPATNVDVVRVACRAEHVTRVKILNGPDTASKTAKRIRQAPRRRGKAKTLRGKPKHRRLCRSAHVEALARIIFAVGGRAASMRRPEESGPAAGVIANKETSQYWLKQKTLPEAMITNHHGNVRGSNAFGDVAALFTIGHNLPPPDECVSTAAAILARDTEARFINRHVGMHKETKYIGVRMNGAVVGAPVETLVHGCNNIDQIIRGSVVGDDIQARADAGAHSGEERTTHCSRSPSTTSWMPRRMTWSWTGSMSAVSTRAAPCSTRMDLCRPSRRRQSRLRRSSSPR